MKIGVLGAPGVRKSQFAKALARDLWDSEYVDVVDNYAQRIKKQSGLALGPWASYSENLMVAGAREAARVKTKKANQITVGTIMDTMVYVMVRSDIAFHRNAQQRRQIAYQEAGQVVGGLTLWYNQTWDYDLCFWLPYQGTPTTTDATGTFPATLSEAYTPVLETFFVPNVFGLTGEAKERVDIASQVIEEFSTDQERTSADPALETAEDEERPVREGSEDGTVGGHPSEPVPDVS